MVCSLSKKILLWQLVREAIRILFKVTPIRYYTDTNGAQLHIHNTFMKDCRDCHLTFGDYECAGLSSQVERMNTGVDQEGPFFL